MNSHTRILVVGANGLIGKHLSAQLEQGGFAVSGTTRTGAQNTIALELARDHASWRPPAGISLAYLCAASTSLDHCRMHPAETFAINVTATVAIARQLLNSGAKVIFLSTNQVFDGATPRERADAPTCPRTEYGKQKAEAERRLLDLGSGVCIVRLTKVLGPDNALLRRWRTTLRMGEAIHPFFDYRMAPLTLNFVTGALTLIGQHKMTGIVQVSADDDITYAQAAQRVAVRIAANPELVQPTSVAAEDIPIWSPAHTTLDATRLKEECGIAPPRPLTAVDAVVDACATIPNL